MKLRDLLIKIRADSVQVDRELSRSARSLDRFAQNTERVGQRLTAGLTLPILGAAGVSAQLASRTEEMGAKFDAVFKGMAGDVEEFAASQAKALNLSRFQYKEWLASLQDTFVPLGFARDRAAELSMSVSSLAVDVATFNDMATPEVVQRFTSALVGNHEAVREFGVVMTQATLKQELMRMGIMGGVQAATEQEKVQARLNLLFAQTADAQGNAAREAQGYASIEDGLVASARDLAIRYGDQLIPVLTEMAQKFTAVARGAESASDDQVRFRLSLAATLALLGPVTLAVAGLAGAVAKLATAMSVGMLPLIGVGGSVLIGLGLLSTALIKVKLDSAAVRNELDGLARSAGQLEENTQEAAEAALVDITRTIEALRQRGVLTEERLRVLLDRAEDINAIWLKLRNGTEQPTGPDAPAPALPSQAGPSPFDAALDPVRIREVVTAVGELPPILVYTSEAARVVGNTLLDAWRVVDQFRDVGIRAFGLFADAMVDSAARGMQAFRQFAASVLRDLARIAARFLVFQGLSALLPGSSTFLDAVGKSFGFRYAGGSVAPGRSYVVGERGPEVFVPHTAGQVRANGAGGSSPSIVLDASRMPAPSDPRQAARDRDWLEFLSHSLREATAAGVRV